MVKNLTLEKIMDAFPNIVCKLEQISAIAKPDTNLVEKFSENFGQGYVNTDKYKQFIIENSKDIDILRYLVYQKMIYEESLESNNVKPSKSLAEFDSEQLRQLTARKALQEINQFLEGESNVNIYFLTRREDGLFEIKEYSTNPNEHKQDKNLRSKYDWIFEDDYMLGLLVGPLIASDLQKILPAKLADVVENKSVLNALIKSRDTYEEVEKVDDTNPEFRLNTVKEMIKELKRFRSKVDIEKLMLISAYRLKTSIQNTEKNKPFTSQDIEAIEDIYNSLIQVSEILGDSGKVKFKGKLEIKSESTESATKKEKFVVYSARDLSRDIVNLRKIVLPSNYKMTADPLATEVEGEINLKGLFEKISPDEKVIDDTTKGEIERNNPLGKYRVNFVSPEERSQIFKSSRKPPITYRGKKGKAYEGHAVYIYEDLKLAILECYWKRDIRFGYGDSTVIVPIEQLEKVLKSNKKLENIPLQKEYKAPQVKEDERAIYSLNTGGRTTRNHIRKQEDRRPIRCPHTKNWREKMIGIVSGEINPFEITIVSRRKRVKPEIKEKDNSTKQAPSTDDLI